MDINRITKSLADWAYEKSWDSVSPSDQASVVDSLIDTVACGIAGSLEPVSALIRNYVSRTAASGSAEIWGSPLKLSPPAAALANGTEAMSQEFDDQHICVGHPSCVLYPALLAVAQEEHLSGLQVLEGYVAGLGVFVAVNHLFGGGVMTHRGWHATSVLGTVGAAAGVAKALGLTREEIATAIGVSVSMAAGLKVNDGSLTKPVHAGRAAAAGVEAALLTRDGLTCAADALEAEDGAMVAFGNVPGSTAIATAEDLKNLIAIANEAVPGLVRKQFPVTGGATLVLEASLAVRDLLPEGVVIKSIRLHLPRGSQTGAFIGIPVHSNDARFSYPYVVAVTLAREFALPRYFLEDELSHEQTAKIMALVSVDEDTTGPFPAGGRASKDAFAEITVEVADGETFSVRSVNPPRNVAGPLVDEKFMNCAQDVMDESEAKELLGSLRNFSELSNLDSIFALR